MCARSRRRSIAGVVGALLLGAGPLRAQSADATRLHAAIDRATAAAMDSVVSWRRDFHQHPELATARCAPRRSSRSTCARSASRCETGVAHTGVVGVLRGGRPGPVVALRADMDALPVTEEVDVPFASHGQRTGRTAGRAA